MSQIIDGWIVLLSCRGTSLHPNANYVHRTRGQAFGHYRCECGWSGQASQFVWSDTRQEGCCPKCGSGDSLHWHDYEEKEPGS